MGEMLPLFPLGAVLYPGMLLPLHIFEERYRQLVGDLLDGAEPRRFGVIAIRKGRETGIDGVRSLYEIGCTATVRRVERHEDGRFDIVTSAPSGSGCSGSTRRGRTCRERSSCSVRSRPTRRRPGPPCG
jgi:Uncharacterized protein, similar to the N-terminal domain of Lon protease